MPRLIAAELVVAAATEAFQTALCEALGVTTPPSAELDAARTSIRLAAAHVVKAGTQHKACLDACLDAETALLRAHPNVAWPV